MGWSFTSPFELLSDDGQLFLLTSVSPGRVAAELLAASTETLPHIWRNEVMQQAVRGMLAVRSAALAARGEPRSNSGHF